MAGKQQEAPVQPIIVRRIKKVEGGHHGGAWKVAYADFVTAMMAFFLLLWLLNVTTDEQKSGLADYFAPTSVTIARSGSGGLLAGRSMALDGARVGDGAPSSSPRSHRHRQGRRPPPRSPSRTTSAEGPSRSRTASTKRASSSQRPWMPIRRSPRSKRTSAST